MILQALKEYYDRKAADPESQMAPPGFEWKEIPFVVVLSLEGEPVNINPTYERQGRNRRAKRFLVPQGAKKTSGITANLLWDTPEYALGVPINKNPEQVKKQHEAFKKEINKLGDLNDRGLQAVNRFLKKNDKEKLFRNFGETWKLLKRENRNVTFQLADDSSIVAERENIKTAVAQYFSQQSKNEGHAVCLVTGQDKTVERLHKAIRGVYGAQTAGANIVSFNLPAFESYGKKQGANAPVSKTAAFAYITALNHLLAKDSRQRMLVGDTSTVFWAKKASELEQQLADFFSEPPKDDPDRGVRAVESLFRSIENGTYITDENEKNRFYVLGLAPNASRIAIRFWIVNSVTGIAGKIKQHFDDLRIVHGPKDKDTFSLFRLLVSTAASGEAKNIPPNLAGEMMRSILEGLPYPRTLLQATIRRIRAEQKITYIRAALIKACINRATRFKNPNVKEELKMGLDENNTNIGYRLGRLFAVLEKIQLETSHSINATIRDRFYGAASGTPSTVFGNLMRLKNHHLAKLESRGRRIYFENLLGRILDGIDAETAFPPHLNLDDQGRFAVGYYHQMQDFFAKKSANNKQQTK